MICTKEMREAECFLKWLRKNQKNRKAITVKTITSAKIRWRKSI